jgi:hypothetical protein
MSTARQIFAEAENVFKKGCREYKDILAQNKFTRT